MRKNGMETSPATHCDWDGQIGMWCNLIFPQMEQMNAYNMLNFSARPQHSWAPNVTVMKMQFNFLQCPSDPYKGLVVGWGGDARIMHYYVASGSSESKNMAYPDGITVLSGAGGGAYGHCNANDGMFYNDSKVKISDVIDGTSQTAMLVETWGRSYRNHRSVTGTPEPGMPASESSRGMNLHTAVYFDWTPNSKRSNPWKANSFHTGGVNCAFGDGSVHFINNNITLAVFKGLSTINGREVISGDQY
jgi:prepilin-type processing-associated H-X9-DG protein